MRAARRTKGSRRWFRRSEFTAHFSPGGTGARPERPRPRFRFPSSHEARPRASLKKVESGPEDGACARRSSRHHSFRVLSPSASLRPSWRRRHEKNSRLRGRREFVEAKRTPSLRTAPSVIGLSPITSWPCRRQRPASRRCRTAGRRCGRRSRCRPGRCRRGGCRRGRRR